MVTVAIARNFQHRLTMAMPVFHHISHLWTLVEEVRIPRRTKHCRRSPWRDRHETATWHTDRNRQNLWPWPSSDWVRFPWIARRRRATVVWSCLSRHLYRSRDPLKPSVSDPESGSEGRHLIDHIALYRETKSWVNEPRNRSTQLTRARALFVPSCHTIKITRGARTFAGSAPLISSVLGRPYSEDLIASFTNKRTKVAFSSGRHITLDAA